MFRHICVLTFLPMCSSLNLDRSKSFRHTSVRTLSSSFQRSCFWFPHSYEDLHPCTCVRARSASLIFRIPVDILSGYIESGYIEVESYKRWSRLFSSTSDNEVSVEVRDTIKILFSSNTTYTPALPYTRVFGLNPIFELSIHIVFSLLLVSCFIDELFSKSTCLVFELRIS